ACPASALPATGLPGRDRSATAARALGVRHLPYRWPASPLLASQRPALRLACCPLTPSPLHRAPAQPAVPRALVVLFADPPGPPGRGRCSRYCRPGERLKLESARRLPPQLCAAG